MTSIWEEDPNVYDAHYWRCRKKLDMTPESIKRDVHQLQLWLKNHPYLPRLTGGKSFSIIWLSIEEFLKGGGYLFFRKHGSIRIVGFLWFSNKELIWNSVMCKRQQIEFVWNFGGNCQLFYNKVVLFIFFNISATQAEILEVIAQQIN